MAGEGGEEVEPSGLMTKVSGEADPKEGRNKKHTAANHILDTQLQAHHVTVKYTSDRVRTPTLHKLRGIRTLEGRKLL